MCYRENELQTGRYMMKRIKVLISILLVMLLLISCGNQDDQNDTSAEENKETGTTEAVTEEI